MYVIIYMLLEKSTLYCHVAAQCNLLHFFSPGFKI